MNIKNKKDDTKGNKKKLDIRNLLNMDIRDLKIKFSKKITVQNNFGRYEKKRKIIAFDIGSFNIKIVVGMYYKNDLTIDKYIVIPTPKDAIVDGEIKKEEELVIRLRKALNENVIKAKDAICTTNSTLIINREIIIPKVEEEEMNTVVRYEIQQYLPINLDDYVLQVTILNEEEIGGVEKLNVRVIAYPEKIAREYYNFLTKLDLKPYVLDVNYNAVNKFINMTEMNNKYEYNSRDSVAFIDMGASFIDVNIYRNGQLDFTRIIKAGGNDINNFFYEINGSKFEEIEELKLERVDLLDEEDSINIEVKHIVDEWIDKIEKIIQFYKNKSVDNNIERILIFGGCSKLRGFETYMTNKIGINTKRIKGISRMTFKFDDDNKPVDDFINVIGSVIRL
ncbi:type IV pilus assembly protein PilM [Clostridium sp. DL-VIII]|uniref:type IV pilus assembly protein PilM n=1 Tax=Clostridium sp. DL-VIII TaxID=641107 RepID=UPI00023B0553|nr:type IV pilus assembly protein PilM [Clostridium sp. DL-VIII]EHJ01424.1 type IV pilus assembly protein PilM [Clostridium sp. DL-VIII]